ncbi:hypothetical protein ACJA88_014234 [Fusarium oxysporum]
MLNRATRFCETYLTANLDTIQTPGVAALLDWLPQFSSDTTDPLILCRAAYNARHAPQIATLEALRQELIVAPQGTAESFRSVKHLVGRLAEKIRTPANLTYLNWRPIDLPERVESEYWPDQRRVLANLSKELSNLVEEQIIAQQQPTPWHPDSITNITAVMGSVAISEVGEVFESGDGESDEVTDSDSLAHLNDDETVDNTDNESGESDEESDGGVGLGY